MFLTRLLTALAVLAASSTAEVAGRYVLTGEREVASELSLKSDGTFEFGLIYGAADYSAKGKWKLDGGFVSLTTNPAQVQPLRLVRSSTLADAEGVRVWVKAPNGRGIGNIDVWLTTPRGEEKQQTEPEGFAMFPLSKVRSVRLRVPVYNVETGPFKLNASHNEFNFEINGEAITRVPFDDERVRMVGDELELSFFNNSMPARYRRQN